MRGVLRQEEQRPSEPVYATSLTCQLLFQSFNLLVQLLQLLVSGQGSSSGRGLKGLGGLCKARGQRSEARTPRLAGAASTDPAASG